MSRYRGSIANLYFLRLTGWKTLRAGPKFAARGKSIASPIAECATQSRVEVSLNVDAYRVNVNKPEEESHRSPRAHIPLKIYFRISRITRELGRGYRADYPLTPTLFIHGRAEILSHARCPISRAGIPLSIVILSIAHTHVYAAASTRNCIDSTRPQLRNYFYPEIARVLPRVWKICWRDQKQISKYNESINIKWSKQKYKCINYRSVKNGEFLPKQ